MYVKVSTITCTVHVYYALLYFSVYIHNVALFMIYTVYIRTCVCVQVVSSIVDQDDFTGFVGAQVSLPLHTTVEPLNNGHIGTDHFVHYREVVLFRRQNVLPLCRMVHRKVSFMQRCP